MMQTWLIEERSSKVFLRRAFPQLQLEERHHQQWLLRQCLHHVVRPFLILRLDSPGTKIPANISFFTVHKEKALGSDLWWYNPKKSPLHLSEHKNIWIYSTTEESLYPRLYCPADYHQVGPSCYAISFFRALGMCVHNSVLDSIGFSQLQFHIRSILLLFRIPGGRWAMYISIRRPPGKLRGR